MGVKISKRYSYNYDSFSGKLFLNVPCDNLHVTSDKLPIRILKLQIYYEFLKKNILKFNIGANRKIKKKLPVSFEMAIIVERNGLKFGTQG